MKFFTTCLPLSVMMLSGWNWTPCSTCWAKSIPQFHVLLSDGCRLSFVAVEDGLLGLYHAWQGSKATAVDLKLANARHSRHMFSLKAESSTTWYACLCIRSPSVEHIPGCGDTVCAEQPWQCHHQSRLSLQVRQAHCPLQWPSCGTEQPGRGLTTPASARITKVSQQSLVL